MTLGIDVKLKRQFFLELGGGGAILGKISMTSIMNCPYLMRKHKELYA